MNKNIKNTALAICLLYISGCGLFSDNKELPKGERIAIVAPKKNITSSTVNSISIQLPPAYSNSNWLQDNSNEQHLMGNLSGTLNQQKWTAKFGEGSSKRKLLTTKPVVSQNMVFVQDANGTVSAFNLDNGQKIWQQKLKPLIKNEQDNGSNGNGLALGNDVIFASTGSGALVALDLKNGKQIWRKELNLPLRSAPTICGQKLLLQSINNTVVALNISNGNELWRYSVPSEDTILSGNATPACNIEKNFAVTGFSNGEIEALNINTGSLLWSTSLIGKNSFNTASGINTIKASPVINEETIYAIGNNDNLAAISYRTGEKEWEHDIGGTTTPLLAGKYLFVLTNNNKLTALDKGNGTVLWATPLLNEYKLKEKSNIILNAPIMLNGNILIAASNGIVYTVSASKGTIIKKTDIGYELSTSPVIAENHVIFITDNARLIVYK